MGGLKNIQISSKKKITGFSSKADHFPEFSSMVYAKIMNFSPTFDASSKFIQIFQDYFKKSMDKKIKGVRSWNANGSSARNAT